MVASCVRCVEYDTELYNSTTGEHSNQEPLFFATKLLKSLLPCSTPMKTWCTDTLLISVHTCYVNNYCVRTQVSIKFYAEPTKWVISRNTCNIPLYKRLPCVVRPPFLMYVRKNIKKWWHPRVRWSPGFLNRKKKKSLS